MLMSYIILALSNGNIILYGVNHLTLEDGGVEPPRAQRKSSGASWLTSKPISVPPESRYVFKSPRPKSSLADMFLFTFYDLAN